jgi:hypothetical protein
MTGEGVRRNLWLIGGGRMGRGDANGTKRRPKLLSGDGNHERGLEDLFGDGDEERAGKIRVTRSPRRRVAGCGCGEILDVDLSVWPVD